MPETSADAEEWARRLELSPHPEGGWYREIYRSPSRVRRGAEERAAVTSIFYLLAAGQWSRWHTVASDEVWSFVAGDPLELLELEPSSRDLVRHRLGCALAAGEEAIAVVPAGRWQAARPLGELALVTCTVAPGFDFADFHFVADLAGHRAAFAGRLADLAGLL